MPPKAQGKKGEKAKKPWIVLSLGGSLLVPDGIDTEFIGQFREFLTRRMKKGERYILVTGGGQTCRRYIEAASAVRKVSAVDQDWLGIHTTRLNAHLVRTVFYDVAHPRINTNPHDLEDFYDAPESLIVAAGWRPGFSTDMDAVLLGKYLGASRVINLTNIDQVYSADPRKDKKAVPYDALSWEAYLKIVGRKWSPGLNAPFDPIAAMEAQAAGIEVSIVNGRKLQNLGDCIDGGEFVGTVLGGPQEFISQ